MLLAVQLLRHMLATHVDFHDLVIACTCPFVLQSAASASFAQADHRETAAQWGRHPPLHQFRIRTEHTNHSAQKPRLCVTIDGIINAIAPGSEHLINFRGNKCKLFLLEYFFLIINTET